MAANNTQNLLSQIQTKLVKSEVKLYLYDRDNWLAYCEKYIKSMKLKGKNITLIDNWDDADVIMRSKPFHLSKLTGKIMDVFPNDQTLGNKINMFFNMKKLFPKDYMNFLPETIKLVNPNNTNIINKLSKDKLFIIKPTNQSCGRLIEVLKPADIIAYINKVDKNNKIQWLIQEYITNTMTIPHLTKKYPCKFDIRVILYMTQLKEVYMYKNICLRVSEEEYNLTNLDKNIHLTNLSVQGINKHTDRNLKKEPALKKYYDPITLFIIKYIKPSLLHYVFCSDDKNYYYQLFGLDLMLTDEGEIKLIELNGDPLIKTEYEKDLLGLAFSVPFENGKFNSKNFIYL